MKYMKEGQMVAAVPVLIGLVVGVAIITVTQIVMGVLGAKTYQIVQSDLEQIGNNVVTGESVTPLTNVFTNFGHSFIQTGTLSVYNTTSKAVVGLGNFSINYDAGTYQAVGANFNNTALSANYTWGAAEVRTSAQNAIVAGFQTQEDTAELTPIVVLSVIMGVVILSIFSYMNFAGGSGGRGSAL